MPHFRGALIPPMIVGPMRRGSSLETGSVAPGSSMAVLLFGPPSPELEAMARDLSTRGWPIHVWKEEDPPAASLAAPRCVWVLLATAPELLPALEARLLARPAEIPLLAVGAAPPARLRVAGWLAEPVLLPLEAMLIHHLGPGASAGPWRRKSDMIVGRSTATRELLHAIDRLAVSTAPVLVTGESGTGKELVARAVHTSSPRAGSRFVAINCAAIPESLFEAELFGFARGAFTGAVAARPGLFETASGGTLFLDEIAEIPPSLQVKLLRVLETGDVTRLGSNETRQVDVRLVAATNRDLEAEMLAGRFREDLFYRLCVCPIHVIPLRERAEDIPVLTAHYLGELARRERRPAPTLAPAALEKLLGYHWPGNVRQLVAVLQRALLHVPGPNIDAEHIEVPQNGHAVLPSYRTAKAEFERRYFSQLLRTTGGQVSLAARVASKTRKEVYDALKRLELEPDDFRSGSAR